MATETLYECQYCFGLKPSENGTGSDVSCCGERGHAVAVLTAFHEEEIECSGGGKCAVRPACTEKCIEQNEEKTDG